MSTNVRLAWFAVLIIVVVSLMIYLATRSGRGYSAERTKSEAEKYGGTIEEGRGGMTAFLWVSFAAIFVWCIVYISLHWNEFSSVFFK